MFDTLNLKKIFTIVYSITLFWLLISVAQVFYFFANISDYKYIKISGYGAILTTDIYKSIKNLVGIGVIIITICFIALLTFFIINIIANNLKKKRYATLLSICTNLITTIIILICSTITFFNLLPKFLKKLYPYFYLEYDYYHYSYAADAKSIFMTPMICFLIIALLNIYLLVTSINTYLKDVKIEK